MQARSLQGTSAPWTRQRERWAHGGFVLLSPLAAGSPATAYAAAAAPRRPACPPPAHEADVMRVMAPMDSDIGYKYAAWLVTAQRLACTA